MVFVCAQCGKRFYKGRRLRDHVATAHPKIMVRVWNESVTTWCKQKGVDPEQFTIHLKEDAKDES